VLTLFQGRLAPQPCGESAGGDARRVLCWGNGHLPAFVAIAAMGAGADVAVQVQGEALAFPATTQLAVVLPAALSVLALAWLRLVGA
jgi:hypothetical protein